MPNFDGKVNTKADLATLHSALVAIGIDVTITQQTSGPISPPTTEYTNAGGLKIMQNHNDWLCVTDAQQELPPTLTVRTDLGKGKKLYYLFAASRRWNTEGIEIEGQTNRGDTITVCVSIHLRIGDEVTVAAVADEPEGIYASWWGDDQYLPLDNPQAIREGREVFLYHPPENKIIPGGTEVFDDELENKTDYSVTHSLAFSLLCCGVSQVRAYSMLNRWNLRTNKPPLSMETLQYCITNVYDRCDYDNGHVTRDFDLRISSRATAGSTTIISMATRDRWTCCC